MQEKKLYQKVAKKTMKQDNMFIVVKGTVY